METIVIIVLAASLAVTLPLLFVCERKLLKQRNTKEKHEFTMCCDDKEYTLSTAKTDEKKETLTDWFAGPGIYENQSPVLLEGETSFHDDTRTSKRTGTTSRLNV